MEAKSIFEFTGYRIIGKGQINFYYKYSDGKKVEKFTEKLFFDHERSRIDTIPSNILDNTLKVMLLMFGVTYWKLFPSSQISLKNIILSKKEAVFWEDVYLNGLGEYFYIKKLNPYNKLKFPVGVNKPSKTNKNENLTFRDIALVQLGGGKDSIVTAEILRNNHFPFSLFTLNRHKIQKDIISLFNIESELIIKYVDNKIFKYNKLLNLIVDPIPFSAIYAFTSLFAAIIYDYKYIIVSNEKSADYGNLRYKGIKINHQWDKTLEFETKFQEYINENISRDILYFSLIKPIWEIKIAKIFSKYNEFFPYFCSCNNNFIDRKTYSKVTWCNNCYKCLDVFILLSAFISKKQLLTIFKEDLYQRKDLKKMLGLLIDHAKTKPFECVSTPDEIKLAMFYASKNEDYQNSYLISNYKKDLKKTASSLEKYEKKFFSNAASKNLPKKFYSFLNNL